MACSCLCCGVWALSRETSWPSAQRGGQPLAVVGEKLGVMRSARDGDVSHAVVKQVFCAQLRIHMHQYPLGGLTLAGVAGHGVAVIEVWMLR